MAVYTKVRGAKGVYLLPSRTGSDDLLKRGGMEFTIATIPAIKKYLNVKARMALIKAWGILGAIRVASMSFGDVTEWVQVDVEQGRVVDSYLVLTDTKNGQKGALSIEYGRSEYLMYRPRNNLDRVSTPEIVRISGMEGKAILHGAFGVTFSELERTGGGDLI